MMRIILCVFFCLVWYLLRNDTSKNDFPETLPYQIYIEYMSHSGLSPLCFETENIPDRRDGPILTLLQTYDRMRQVNRSKKRRREENDTDTPVFVCYCGACNEESGPPLCDASDVTPTLIHHSTRFKNTTSYP